jgi:DNA polymerase/3'-5' exonuclease PolX
MTTQPKVKPEFSLKAATLIAESVKERLAPVCERIEIAGSIRRGKPVVHDIDIVCILGEDFLNAIQAVYNLGRFIVQGPKIWRIALPEGIEADIYLATPETWATLLLIRTGSKEHNIKLCQQAKRRGMKLHADGSGVELWRGNLLPCMNEQEIFAALGLVYAEPWEREV